MAPEFELDKWIEKYAQRTLNMKSSAIRDLLAVTEQPNIISLAGGLPETSIFDISGMQDLAAELLHNDIHAAFQYGPSDGYLPLRESICNVLADEGIKASSNEIIVTGGAQQALDLIGKILIDPGDFIIVEAPTYVGAINSFSSYQTNYLTVPMDENGIDIDKLEQVIETFNNARQVRKPSVDGETTVNYEIKGAKTPKIKFLYTIPNFQNPAGVTMSLERRHRLIEICRKSDIIIIEDNPYGRLIYEGDPMPTLRSLDKNVIYLGTFSKIFSPGVRVGWILAPGSFVEKLIHAKQAADLCSSSLTQRLVARFFESDLKEKHLNGLIKVYSERRDAMLSALDKYFPEGTSWTKPKGGFFVWASVPEFIDTKEMLAEAINRGVAYVPGGAFFPDGSGTNFMRLAYCFVDAEKIDQAIKQLGKVIKEQIELYNSLKF